MPIRAPLGITLFNSVKQNVYAAQKLDGANGTIAFILFSKLGRSKLILIIHFFLFIGEGIRNIFELENVAT